MFGIKIWRVAHYSHQGFKNIETKKEIDNETIFRIYSMTKTITSCGDYDAL